jgi:hypothetical protein
MKKFWKIFLIVSACVIGAVIVGFGILFFAGIIGGGGTIPFNPPGPVAKKPVIYLYPENETDVFVKLDFNGRLTCTYPEYGEGWKVIARPDGTLIDAEGKEYSCLFWEGESAVDYDLQSGFCVKGEDTASFLEDALGKLGLTPREANEFIVFWLPMMQDNAYNLISFAATGYTENAKLAIDPAPDTLIRVFMVWKGVDSETELEPEELVTTERTGFTVVEWGGAEVQ